MLGTDKLGRDILVRLLYGARISLAVAFAATGIALVIGVVLGMVAGYFRGPVDAVISRAIETAMAFPALLLAIGLAVVIGPGLGERDPRDRAVLVVLPGAARALGGALAARVAVRRGRAMMGASARGGSCSSISCRS